MPSRPSTPRDKNTTIAENTSHHQAKEPKSMISHDDSTSIGNTTEGFKSVSNSISDTSAIPTVNVISLDSEYQSKGLDDTQIKLGPSSVSSTLAIPETPRHRIIRSFPIKQHLFDINLIRENTHNYDYFRVHLKEAPNKGIGIFASRKILANRKIAYYKAKVYKDESYNSTTNCTYCFTVFIKKGDDYVDSEDYIADIYEDSNQKPRGRIPFWVDRFFSYLI